MVTFSAQLRHYHGWTMRFRVGNAPLLLCHACQVEVCYMLLADAPLQTHVQELQAEQWCQEASAKGRCRTGQMRPDLGLPY